MSVVIHEQGHILGLEDNYNASSSVLEAGFTEGERRLPEFGEADGAVPFSLEGDRFSHFRFGTMTWDNVGPAANRTVEFANEQSWRRTFFLGSGGDGHPVVGDVINTSTLFFGDGGSAAINLEITSIDLTNDLMVGQFEITHTYAADGFYSAGWDSCCRVSTLDFGNADAFWHGCWQRSALIQPSRICHPFRVCSR